MDEVNPPALGRFDCAGIETEVEYDLLGDGIGLVRADASAARAWRAGPANLHTADGRRRPVILTLVSAEGRGYLFVPAADAELRAACGPPADPA